jgi:tRNA nucleotidyltransferase (CCA-adding enzyme)
MSHEPLPVNGTAVLDALGAEPGGSELLALGEDRAEPALVGGAVRDLLLGRSPRELDVVVAHDAAGFAAGLSAALGASAVVHERFGTAVVAWRSGRVDVAERRAESYPSPGALPQVRPGTSKEDLGRRDFSVNAIAIPLGGSQRGAVLAAEHGLHDLALGRLRVLHADSFIDDPTRLLRLARYSARLGFEIERHTGELASAALAAGALRTVSLARIGAELRLALGEPGGLSSLAALRDLGVLAAIGPGLDFDQELAERAIALLPADGCVEVLLMAALALAQAHAPGAESEREAALRGLLDGLEFPAAEREAVVRSAIGAPRILAVFGSGARPSELHRALSAEPCEAIALAGALAGEGAGKGAPVAAAEWFSRLRHVRLEITGDDLLAGGVPSGPRIGRGLAAALALKLDGELPDGREAELLAAIRASQ